MNEFGVLVTVSSVWGWVAFMLLFFFRAFPSRGVFAGREALKWGGLAALCFCVWIAAMMVI